MTTDPPPVRTERPPRLPNHYALFATAAGAATAVGVAIGGLVGWAAAGAHESSCAPYDDWCGLGAALAGLFFGGLAGIVTYVAVGVTIIVRCRPRGRRTGHIVAHLGFPPATVLVLTAIGSAIP